MDLNWIKLQGYKRLESETLKTSGKVVAIIGPNEAGKSSILKALEHLNHAIKFSQNELTRGKEFKDDDVILEAGFLLDESDRAVISGLCQDNKARQFRIYKLANGSKRYEIIPSIQKDLSPRLKLKDFLESLDKSTLSDLKLDTDQVRKLISELSNTDEIFQQGTLVEIKNNLSSIPILENKNKETKNIQTLKFLINSLIGQEPDPKRKVEEILIQRIPKVLFFDSNQRNLISTHDLTQSPPPALCNLANLANLDLTNLNDSIANGDMSRVRTLLNRANTRIADIVKGKWSQSGIKVSLTTNNHVLYVLIEDEKQDCTNLDDRSDGLRQFVALINFLEVKHADLKPILLVDEAETHLHYDAQADLMSMFARQELASKIIYTTHSAGCLPEDIGTGVRCIIPDKNLERSKIKNWFWQDSKPGFSPLLFSMGANSLAFVPVRKAVFVEGATDMLLLPTIFRQLSKRSHLGFQIAPGLSIATQSDLSLLENEAPRIAFLTDNDAAGQEIIKQLKKAGIDESRIFRLPGEEGLVLEDCINKKLYVKAVNEELKNWNQVHPPVITLEDLPDPDINRPKTLEKWCEAQGIKPPDKKIIAYRLLDFATDERQEFLVRADLERPLRQLYEDIAKELDV